MEKEMKKYKLTDEEIVVAGRNLRRIEALKDFGDVCVGDKGGFIGSEYNLSHEGECWVYDNAAVHGNARVCDNARVCGDAEVYNCAVVCDNAIVYDNAEVYNCARVYDNAITKKNRKTWKKK